MRDLWLLPVQTRLGDDLFDLHADYREILQVIACLEDRSLPEPVRWLVALALFYGQPVPAPLRQQAMEYLAYFISCGEDSPPGPRLLDWQQDASAIIAGVNQVAGQEVRALPFVHWWTFLSWFHGIGEGQLSTLVSIRERLAKGKKLEPWQKDFYRENKHRVDLKKRYTRQEMQERERLNALLDGN